MGILNLIGIVLFITGILWLPLAGLFLSDVNMFGLGIAIIVCTGLGAFIVWKCRRDEEEIQRLNDEEAEAMVQGTACKDNSSSGK